MINVYRPFTGDQDIEALQKELEAQADAQMLGLQQTPVWARFMAWLLGNDHVEFWTLRDGNGTLRAASWVYAYPLKWGKYWLYAARGPVLMRGQKEDAARQLLNAVRKAHPGAVWLRWDPLFTDDTAKNWQEGAMPAHASFHPKSTLVLDLNLGSEALLAQMKPKGRYNIRVAQKKGVRVHGWSMTDEGWQAMTEAAPVLERSEAVDIYTRLSRETTSRDGFSGHNAAYFDAFLTTMAGHSFLLLAEVEGHWIAGGIFTLLQGVCTYYYGASSNAHREKMAPYLVQWAAIEHALAEGCHTYDFLGIATPGSTHPSDLALSGVTDFKGKFGGIILTRGRSWEKIMHPALFWGIRAAKNLRPFLSRVRRG